jgi:hypothetical protein
MRQLDVPDAVGSTRSEAANSATMSLQTPPQVETLPIAASTLTPVMKEQ